MTPELQALLATTFKWLDEKNWLPWYKNENTGKTGLAILTEELRDTLPDSVYVMLEKQERQISVWTYRYRDNNPNTRRELGRITPTKLSISPLVAGLLTEETLVSICQRIMQLPESLEPKYDPRNPLIPLPKASAGALGKRGDSLQVYLYYVSNPDHVWDKEKYKSSNFSGYAFDLETRLRFTYCLGNSHMEGMIGDWKIEVHYQYLQGFQVRLTPPTPGATVPHFTYPPDSPASVYTAVKSWVNPSYEE